MRATTPRTAHIHLEGQTALDVLLQRLGDGLIKVAQDLHRQLRVDALLADEVVESIRQSETDAMQGERPLV